MLRAGSTGVPHHPSAVAHADAEGRSTGVGPSVASDPTGFEAAVRACQPQLVSRLTLILRDSHEARDIAQETLLRAWQAWPGLRHDDLLGWLTVVGSRLAFNELRRRRRRPWSRLVREPSNTAAMTVDPDLWAALGDLRAEERPALVLHVLGGYTHAEIGSQLSVAPGTVGSWISRAKARLRTTLTPEDHA